MKCFFLLIPLFLASCQATVKHSFTRDISSIRKVAIAPSERAEKDSKVELFIGEEARKRGLSTVTQGAEATLRYTDTWKWDLVMYLRGLDIEIVMPDGEIIGSVSWFQKHHGLATQESAVRETFVELDRAGLGKR